MTDSDPRLLNRYDRQTFGPGLEGWLYEYTNREPLTRTGGVASGLEIGVQLRGGWTHKGSRSGKRLYEAGTIHKISVGEFYDVSFQARAEKGVQVGFIFYPEEVAAYRQLDGQLCFAPGAALTDPGFLSFCNDLRQEVDGGRPVSQSQVFSEVDRFIQANCQLLPTDPILAAKRELDRHFARPLYLAQLAEVAGMHPTTFARSFARRFGRTPINYRLNMRITMAGRLTWSRPELGIPAIAHEVGFEDLAFFHRAFRKTFGMTPAVFGRRSRGLQ